MTNPHNDLMAIDMPHLKPHALKYMYILPCDRIEILQVAQYLVQGVRFNIQVH